MNFDHVVVSEHHHQQQQHRQRHPSSCSHQHLRSNDFASVSSLQGEPIADSYYFDEYDHAMEAVRLEADLQDYYHGLHSGQRHQDGHEHQRHQSVRHQSVEPSTSSTSAAAAMLYYEKAKEHHQRQQSLGGEREEHFYDGYDSEGSGYNSNDEEEEDRESAASVESYNNDALLYLILGVQSYISEMSNTGLMNERDSPLFELQYKMYTYMKQRACEMGFDADSLPPPP